MAAISRPIRLLLADDHVIVRHGIAAIVQCEPDMEVVGQAADGREAIDLYRQLRPDVLLVDLRMPERDGFVVLRTLKESFRDLKAIVTTCVETEDEINRSFRLGAKSFLTKDVTGPVLIEAIRQVALGKAYVPPSIALKLIDSTMRPPLSDRENEVLLWITQGLSNKEIGGKLFIAEGTVKSHVKSLLSKLGVSNRSEAAAVGTKRGLVACG